MVAMLKNNVFQLRICSFKYCYYAPSIHSIFQEKKNKKHYFQRNLHVIILKRRWYASSATGIYNQNRKMNQNPNQNLIAMP